MKSPLALEPLFHVGPVGITEPVVVSWAVIAALGLGSALATRRLSIIPSKGQTLLELVVSTIDSQIRETMQTDPAPFRALIGSIFLFTLVSNWSSLIPGIEPATAHLETDAAMALIIFVATIGWGIRVRGIGGYLATYAEPTWVMIPLNIVEQFTRTFSLIVRLFGNVMSGVFIIGIILTLAGLLVPIPLMALDLLTGAVQAYIFAVLATVFIGAAVGERRKPSVPSESKSVNDLIQAVSIFSAALAVGLGAIGPGIGEGHGGRLGDGRHRAPAGGVGHDLAHPVRRPRHDRDDGDLLPRRRAAGAVRQPVRQIGRAMRIDWWTLGLQTVNVLILVAILARFLFRPVIAIMEERQAAAAKALGDAETAKARAIAARDGRRGREREARRRARCSAAPGGGGRQRPARGGARRRERGR